MSDKPIADFFSERPDASYPSDADMIPILQGGEVRKISARDLVGSTAIRTVDAMTAPEDLIQKSSDSILLFDLTDVAAESTLEFAMLSAASGSAHAVLVARVDANADTVCSIIPDPGTPGDTVAWATNLELASRPAEGGGIQSFNLTPDGVANWIPLT